MKMSKDYSVEYVTKSLYNNMTSIDKIRRFNNRYVNESFWIAYDEMFTVIIDNHCNMGISKRNKLDKPDFDRGLSIAVFRMMGDEVTRDRVRKSEE